MDGNGKFYFDNNYYYIGQFKNSKMDVMEQYIMKKEKLNMKENSKMINLKTQLFCKNYFLYLN